MDTRSGFLISQIRQVQGRVFQRLLQDCGIEAFNGAQGRILYVLWQEDGIPIAVLVKKIGLAKNTLTSMLARMEETGLILRRPDTRDRRQTLICLTDNARTLKEPYDRVSQQMNELFFQNFTMDEVEELERLLGKVLANLEDCETRQRKG